MDIHKSTLEFHTAGMTLTHTVYLVWPCLSMLAPSPLTSSKHGATKESTCCRGCLPGGSPLDRRGRLQNNQLINWQLQDFRIWLSDDKVRLAHIHTNGQLLYTLSTEYKQLGHISMRTEAWHWELQKFSVADTTLMRQQSSTKGEATWETSRKRDLLQLCISSSS